MADLDKEVTSNEGSRPSAPHIILGLEKIPGEGAFKTLQGPTSKVVPNPDLQVRVIPFNLTCCCAKLRRGNFLFF